MFQIRRQRRKQNCGYDRFRTTIAPRDLFNPLVPHFKKKCGTLKHLWVQVSSVHRTWLTANVTRTLPWKETDEPEFKMWFASERAYSKAVEKWIARRLPSLCSKTGQSYTRFFVALQAVLKRHRMEFKMGSSSVASYLLEGKSELHTRKPVGRPSLRYCKNIKFFIGDWYLTQTN